MARPKKQVDPVVVEKLAEIHCTMIEIGYAVGVSVDTLERRFADIIKRGKAAGCRSLRRMQFEAAQKGNSALLIWLGKQLLDQVDKSHAQIDQRTEVIKLSPAQKQERIEVLQKKLGACEGR